MSNFVKVIDDFPPEWVQKIVDKCNNCDHKWEKHAFMVTTSGQVLKWELRCHKCHASRPLPKRKGIIEWLRRQIGKATSLVVKTDVP